MQNSDSKARLSSLRKLYFRLQKIVLQSGSNDKEGSDLQRTRLWAILLVEAARRLRKLELSPADLCKITSTFLSSCSDLRANPLDTERILQFFQTSHCFELQKQLVKHAELLDEFDERFAGYFYQFSQEAARDFALERIQSSDKRSSRNDIIHFTQLYTPDWVADYLLQETLLPQWKEHGDESSRIEKGLAPILNDSHSRPYHLPAVSGTGTRTASELTVLDPSCGAGHILLRAFELLMQLHLSEGKRRAEACKAILNQNLYACDLDENALEVCAFSLIIKALKDHVDIFELKLKLFNVSSFSAAEEEFEPGSLKREWKSTHALSKRYNAVVTNPPYIGRRLLDRRLKQFLRSEFPAGQHDLSAAFLLRALELTESSGRVGFITQSSLLYLPSYEELRKQFIENNTLVSIVELGTRVFPLSSGEKINSMLIILRNENQGSSEASFLDLTKSPNKCDALLNTAHSRRDCKEFLLNRSYAFNYRYPDFLAKIMDHKSKLGDFIEIKQGLATSDNARFVRFFWDVDQDEIGKRWHPYVKGAGSQRWYAPCHTVLDWGTDGSKIKEAVEKNYPYLKGRIAWVVKNESFYFRRGLTFSFVSTGNFAVRRMDPGSIFDVGGSALFCKESEEDLMLAYLNSSFASLCAHVLNPTLNFQVGDIKQIPLPDFDDCLADELKDLAQKAQLLKRELGKFNESSPDFQTPDFINTILQGQNCIDELFTNIQHRQAELAEQLHSVENTIDQLILKAIDEKHSLSSKDRDALFKLIEQQAAGKQFSNPYFANEHEFVEFLLRLIIDKASASSGILITNHDEPLNSLIDHRLRSSIEAVLKMSLNDYLLKCFNRSQEKTFFGSPKIISVFEPSRKQLIFVPSKSVRAYTKTKIMPVDTTKTAEETNTAAEILASIANSLNAIPDWTGKDLSKIVQTNFYRETALLKFEES